MNKKKKIILSLLIIIVVAGAAVLTVFILKKRTRSNKTVNVYPLETLGYSSADIGMSSTLSGSVAIDKEQKIYLQATDQIAEVKVSEGDTVKAGDVLLVYDTTSQQLKLESMRADVSVAQADVQAAQRDLKILQNTTPVEPTTEEPSTEEPSTEEPSTEEPEEPTTEAPTTEAPTTEEPSTGETTTETPPSDTQSQDVSAVSVSANEVIMLSEPDNADDGTDTPEVTYTKEELEKAIQEKQNEIKKLNVEYQLKQVELEIMEYQAATGEVVCNFDGVVKTVADQETAILNNEPFIVVSGTDGYTVQGYIGELSLGTVKVGDMVSMYSYDNGMTYMGEISEISDMPTSDYYSYDGTEETYYPMTITVTEGDDLTQGMYMEITLLSSGESTDSFYIPMALVDKDNGSYYVMKEVDGRLKKVFIKTGKIIWGGDSIEVLSGVTAQDYVAIPYASNAKEGVKTVEKTADDAYGY